MPSIGIIELLTECFICRTDVKPFMVIDLLSITSSNTVAFSTAHCRPRTNNPSITCKHVMVPSSETTDVRLRGSSYHLLLCNLAKFKFSSNQEKLAPIWSGIMCAWKKALGVCDPSCNYGPSASCTKIKDRNFEYKWWVISWLKKNSICSKWYIKLFKNWYWNYRLKITQQSSIRLLHIEGDNILYDIFIKVITYNFHVHFTLITVIYFLCEWKFF